MTDYFIVKRNPELIERAVLDKIRDEIKAEMDDIASGCVAKYSYDEGYYSGLRWTLKIIDKYKEQTECTHTQ